MKRATSLAAAVVLTAGCGAGAARPAPAAAGTDLRQVQLTAAELHGLADADAAFGRELFARVSTSDRGNVVLSPVSIATALQMAYVGARGQTGTEMARTLHLDGRDPAQTAAAASRLLAELAPLAHDQDELLDLVNQVWVQSGFALTPAYDAMMRTGFGAEFRRTDFAGDPDASRQAINAEVADTTHNKIRDLIAKGQIDSDTRLVLTNAVYLKAKWDAPFEPSETMPRAFHRLDGSTVPTDTMALQRPVSYSSGPGYQAVRLPYVGGRLAMTVVVPTGPERGYPASLAPFHDRYVDLWLPKFRFSWSGELSGTLAAMGMRIPFTPAADFSGVNTDPSDPLDISFVAHKAFVAVDEDGTEAAAATAVGLGEVVSAHAPPTTVVHADHPFYFSISDTETGLELFVGHVTDPTAS